MNEEISVPKLRKGSIHVWLVDIEEPSEDFSSLERNLSADELARGNRYKFERDRRRFVLRRGILRKLLSLFTGVDAARIEYQVNPFGKLSLTSNAIRFSVAHSQDRVAYAFSAECDIGVDIERVKPLQDPEKLARHWFSQPECNELFSLDPSRRLDGFFHVWTQKEAFVKARGEGLTYPLQNFSVSANPDSPGGLLSIENEDLLQWRMLAVAPEPDWHVAVCVRSRIAPILDLKKTDLVDFSARFLDTDS